MGIGVDQVGVDAIQFACFNYSNQYAVVFLDYFTKWPMVFLVAELSGAIVARLLVKEIIAG